MRREPDGRHHVRVEAGGELLVAARMLLERPISIELLLFHVTEAANDLGHDHRELAGELRLLRDLLAAVPAGGAR